MSTSAASGSGRRVRFSTRSTGAGHASRQTRPCEPDTFDDAATANDRREHIRPSRRVGTTSARRSLAAQHAAQRSMIERIADRLTRIAASTPFLVLHVAWFLAWMLLEHGRLRAAAVRPDSRSGCSR
jgi:hypothetical protein